MSQVADNTSDVSQGVHPVSIIDQLSSRVRGQVLRPRDDGYHEARRIWNAMIDRRPAAILRCVEVADVIEAVGFARENGLLLSVRGGGHNVAGNAVCDGGLMIDLSLMRNVQVDQSRRIAQAQGGATWRDLDSSAQAFGLGTTGGVIPATGIAGLTLGGGLGWLMRKYGLSCDNLLSAQVVMADGQCLSADADNNPDLFWGLRGGGGNFGIVTSLQYQLHAVGNVVGGMVLYPLDHAANVLRFARDYLEQAPDRLGAMAVFVTGPDGNKALAVIVCWCGETAEGEHVLQPLRAFGTPVADTITSMPYDQFQSVLEPGFPPGLQNYWKSNFLRELSDDAIHVLVESFKHVPSATSAMAIELLGGAVSKVTDEETAFTHRSARFNLLIVSSWPSVADTDVNVGWTRRVWDDMQPYASQRVYVNYLGQVADEGTERVRAAYGNANYKRLVALKRKFDPENIFRANQNVSPNQ